ncbi:hypothetical protein Tco_1140707 [Tanacetum coccineum]
MDHQTSSIPQNDYHSPLVSTQPMTEFPQLDSGLVVPVFTQGDDPISCLNKAMVFLSAVAALRFPSTNNQLKLPLIQEIRPLFKTAGLLCNTFKEGKDKFMLVLVIRVMLLVLGEIMQEGRQGLLNSIIVKTEDLDAYDSDCDDVSNAKAVLMANLSNYCSDVISEAAVQDTNLNAQQDSMILYGIEKMSEQMINPVNNWEKANHEKNNESLTVELEIYKERVKTFEQRLNIDLSTREKMIDSQNQSSVNSKTHLYPSG